MSLPGYCLKATGWHKSQNIMGLHVWRFEIQNQSIGRVCFLPEFVIFSYDLYLHFSPHYLRNLVCLSLSLFLSLPLWFLLGPGLTDSVRRKGLPGEGEVRIGRGAQWASWLPHVCARGGHGGAQGQRSWTQEHLSDPP